MDRIQKNYGVDRFQRPLLPFFRHRQNLIRDPAYRTIATFNPLGFPERAISDGTRTREIIEKKLVGMPDITEPMPEGFGMYAR